MDHELSVFFNNLLSSMASNGSLGATLPIGYRIQASILILFLVYIGIVDLRIFGWGVFHPHEFMAHYWRSASIFPAGVSIVIVIVSLLAGSVGLFIGFQMSQRKLQGFSAAVRCAPYLMLVALLELLRVATTSKPQDQASSAPRFSSHDVFVRDIGTHVLQNHAQGAQGTLSPHALAIAFVVIAFFMSAFYFWLFRFARNPKNRQFIKEKGLGVI